MVRWTRESGHLLVQHRDLPTTAYNGTRGTMPYIA
jgi:hypothetical protein